MRHAEWAAKRQVKRAVLNGPGYALSTAERQTGTSLNSDFNIAFGERILAQGRKADPRQPRWLNAWCLGFDASDVLALSGNGQVRHYGNWRIAPGNARASKASAAKRMAHTQWWAQQKSKRVAMPPERTAPPSTWPAKRLLDESADEKPSKKKRAHERTTAPTKRGRPPSNPEPPPQRLKVARILGDEKSGVARAKRTGGANDHQAKKCRRGTASVKTHSPHAA